MSNVASTVAAMRRPDRKTGSGTPSAERAKAATIFRALWQRILADEKDAQLYQLRMKARHVKRLADRVGDHDTASLMAYVLAQVEPR